MAVLMGGLVNLPAWANGWNKDSVAPSLAIFSLKQEVLLAEIVETIIPTTNTPGAKELDVHTFIQKILADCSGKKVQDTFAKGVDSLEASARQNFGKSFAACDTVQRTGLLKKMEQESDTEKKEFFSIVKGLTIRGYMTSEYVMTNLTHYEAIPSRYHGCVPVPAK
jgi:hypothetical protein